MPSQLKLVPHHSLGHLSRRSIGAIGGIIAGFLVAVAALVGVTAYWAAWGWLPPSAKYQRQLASHLNAEVVVPPGVTFEENGHDLLEFDIKLKGSQVSYTVQFEWEGKVPKGWVSACVGRTCLCMVDFKGRQVTRFGKDQSGFWELEIVAANKECVRIIEAVNKINR